MKKLFGILVLFSVVLFSCSEETETDLFELTGTWEANDVAVAEGVLAQITTTLTESTYSGTTEIVSPAEATATYKSTGKLVSFSNEKNWYIAKVTTAEDANVIGKYGRTDYVLADDGKSFTGTSYSYEDTETKAMESKTVQIAEITCTKQ